MQGVVRTFDPLTHEGTLLSDADRAEYTLALDALDVSIFRILRQGQRVNFDLDDAGRATRVRIGAELDMSNPTAEV